MLNSFFGLTSSSSIGTATLVGYGLACSTIVEYSQQEGFYRMPLPVARQTPQLGGFSSLTSTWY